MSIILCTLDFYGSISMFMAVSVCDIFYFGFQLNGLKGAITLVKFVGKTVSGFVP
jgi:hypothetical protein